MSFSDIQHAFMAHIRDPESNPCPNDIEDRRMAIYRGLFFNNIEGFLASAFPVLKSLYHEEAWLALVRRFFAEHQANSPYFLEISQEFLEYLATGYEPLATDPPFMLELAHYEWLELDVATRFAEDDERPLEQGECGEAGLQFSNTASLVGYRYPVQQISPDYRPEEASGEGQHFIVVYQDADKEVQFLAVNAMTALMLQTIQSSPGITLNALVKVLSTHLPQFSAEQLEQGARATVTSLAERRILVTKK